MPFATSSATRRRPACCARRWPAGACPQSLLFAGPEGVGKRAVATALAQAVNCPIRRKSGGDDACGTCPTCTRIARGMHSDVVVIDKGDEASIKIKTLARTAARGHRLPAVRGRAARVHHRSGRRDDRRRRRTRCSRRSRSRRPRRSSILVTAYPDTLSPTIQSRCRRLRFGPLPEPDVARVLVERLKIDRGKARGAGGRVGRQRRARAGGASSATSTPIATQRWRSSRPARGRVGDKLKAAAELAKHGSNRRDREALGDAARDRRVAPARSQRARRRLVARRSPTAISNATARARRDLRSAARSTDELRRDQPAQDALDRNASPKIVADWLAESGAMLT